MKASTLPQSGKKQRGVALLVALLVVALATVLIAGLLDRGGLVAARTRNLLRQGQAQAYARGLENYAAEVLVRAQDQSAGYDAVDSVWAIPLAHTGAWRHDRGADVRSQRPFQPQQSRSCLRHFEAWRGNFVLLLTALKLDPAIAGHIATWMDANTPASADDQFYLAQPVPYRRAGRAFAHVSELRLIAGIDGDTYAALAPYVAALPPGTPINVNTASVPVLMTLGANTTREMAQAIWQQGGAHYSGVDQVLKAQPALGAIEHPECYDVRSSYFRARGLITLDDLPFEFDSLIERRSGSGGGIRVLQRSRGGDD